MQLCCKNEKKAYCLDAVQGSFGVIKLEKNQKIFDAGIRP